MKNLLTAIALAAMFTAAWAQAPQRPMFETRKVEGTDNVYVFRYGNHQSMFVVTKDGVIATDPIGYGRPQAVTTYIDEIKKVTDKPIKYLVYSHITTITSRAASRSRTRGRRSSRTSVRRSASRGSRIRPRRSPTRRSKDKGRSSSAAPRSSSPTSGSIILTAPS